MAQVPEPPLSPIPPSQEMLPAFSGHSQTYRERVSKHPPPRKLGETQLSSPSQIKLGHKCHPPHPRPVLI